MRRLRRRLAAVALALLVLLAVAAAAAVMVLRATVPRPSGSLAIAGLERPVEVVRDREGVPHVLGRSLDDLATALGFTHAQDRLWQMELARRAGQGRLSELFGEATLQTDIFLRTLDLAGHAERSLAALPADARRMLEAYARGVNAYLGRRTGALEPRLPPEFLLLWHTPEPWRPADCMLLIKLMALNLSANLREEIMRLSFAAAGLGVDEIEDLMPPDLADGRPPLPEIASLYPVRRLAEAPRPRASFASLLDDIGTGASNNWVVSGARTRSGKPLLANDPHLRLSAPSIWYLAHLSLVQPDAAPVDIVGASLPGTPLVVLGRGNTLAWGFTTTGADVQDLYIEKVDPDDPSRYLTPDGWRRFGTETVTIGLRGGRTFTLERRTTRHGPVLPASFRNLGRILGPGHVAALQWTALTDDNTTIAAGLLDPRIRTTADFMARMHLYVAPMQSIVVADTNGSIGLIAPSRVPVRDPANRVAGRAPVPGWDATYDWKGLLPFDAVPRVIDPADGAIGTTNNRIVGPGYPHVLTYDWEPDYRQRRLADLVLDRGGHDISTMRAAQLDELSLAAVELKPLLVASARAAGSRAEDILTRIEAWDGMLRAPAAEPLIFKAWVRETVRAIWRDRLGPAFDLYFDMHAHVLARVLEGRAAVRWCGEKEPGAAQWPCARLVAGALTAALAELELSFGSDRGTWTWGRAHFAHGEHRPFGDIPFIGRLFNVEVETGGGTYTLNRGKTTLGAELPFANRLGASYRAIYDLADLDRSLYIQSTGQSGNPFSPYYRSFARRWARGEYITIPTQRDQIDSIAIGTWMLTP